MTKEELIILLEDTKSETIEHFRSNEHDLGKTYGPDKWNIRQILHHLTDTEVIFVNRIKRIIAEPKQVIWVAQQNDWNEAFHYIDKPLGNNAELYTAARNANLNLFSDYFHLQGATEFVHSEMGLRTLEQEMIKIVLHNQKHLKQIKLALVNG